jgi:hypothetical protein
LHPFSEAALSESQLKSLLGTLRGGSLSIYGSPIQTVGADSG